MSGCQGRVTNAREGGGHHAAQRFFQKVLHQRCGRGRTGDPGRPVHLGSDGHGVRRQTPTPASRRDQADHHVRRGHAGRPARLRPRTGQALHPRPAAGDVRGRQHDDQAGQQPRRRGQPARPRRRLRHRQRRHADDEQRGAAGRFARLRLALAHRRHPPRRHHPAGQRGLLALPRPRGRHPARLRRRQARTVRRPDRPCGAATSCPTSSS